MENEKQKKEKGKKVQQRKNLAPRLHFLKLSYAET